MKTFMWLVGTLLALVVVVDMATSSKGGAVPESAPEVSQDAVHEPLKDSCAKLTNLLGYHSNLSDVQQDDLWEKSYNGRQFKWTLQLLSAEAAYNGSFNVTFVCLPPTRYPTMIEMVYPSEAKKTVLGFKKGTPYKISGVLTEFETAPPELSDELSVRFYATPVIEPAVARIPTSK